MGPQRLGQPDRCGCLQLLDISALITQAWWSPDATRVVTVGDDYLVMVWDANTGAMLHKLRGHTAAIARASWNRQGIAYYPREQGTARLWDANTGKELLLLGRQGAELREAT